MKKIKIAQIGITHEHAPGKYATLKNMPETYELVGVYNDMDTYSTPAYIPPSLLNAYKDANWMSLDEILNYPDLDAVAVEVPNNELVPIAMRCMERWKSAALKMQFCRFWRQLWSMAEPMCCIDVRRLQMFRMPLR